MSGEGGGGQNVGGGQGGHGGGRKRRRRRRGGGGGGQKQNGQQGPGQQAQGQQGRGPHQQGQGGRKQHDGRGGQRDRQKPQAPAPRMDLRIAREDQKAAKPEAPFHHVLRRYAVAIFDTVAHAKADLDKLREQSKDVDQLNIVIRAEGGMDDPDLNSIGNVKVFAGAAWTTIHERRIADGWYAEPR